MAVPLLFAVTTSTLPKAHLPLRDHSYVCATLDFWPSTKCDYGNCSWVDTGFMALDFENPILNQASELLGPNFVYRVGGTLADQVKFDSIDPSDTWGHCTCEDPDNPTEETCYFKEVGQLPPQGNFAGFEQGCLTGKRLDLFLEFAEKSKKKIIFDFSSVYGRQKLNYVQWEGDWVSDNAKEFFEYIIEQNKENLFLGFELGNEVWGIKTGFAHFTAEQGAHDYKTLRTLMDDHFGKDEKQLLVLSGNWENNWLTVFSDLFDRFDGVAWHWYPLGAGSGAGVIPNVNNPDFLKEEIIPRLELTEAYGRKFKKQLWMGETGGAFNSGQNTTTNTFMSHRWYLDQLGQFAVSSHVGYCRQTLIGGNYGLIQNVNGLYIPNPDFYAAFLFHHLMGDAVYTSQVQISPDQGDYQPIHTYVHNDGSTGSTTVLIINFEREHDIVFNQFNGMEIEKMDAWIASAEDDQDKLFEINGRPVEVIDNIVPNVLDFVQQSSMPVTIPPLSYAFFRFRIFE